MPRLTILRPYKYSPNGIDIVRVQVGEKPDIPDPFYTSAITHGFAEAEKPKKRRQQKRPTTE